MIQQLTQLGLTTEDATAIKAAADDASNSPLVYSVSQNMTLAAGLPPRVPVYLVNSSGGVVSVTLPSAAALGAEIRIVGAAPTANDIVVQQPNVAGVQVRRGSITSTPGVGGAVEMQNGANTMHLVHVGGAAWAIVSETGTNQLV